VHPYTARRIVTRVISPAAVSLRRWLRRQLRQPIAAREHLEAAIAADDPGEVRRLLERFSFTPAQRHHVEALLAAWETEQERDD
jgi:hypothetical protein